MRTQLDRLACIAVVLALAAAPAMAGDIIADWNTVKLPPAPELKPAKLADKFTQSAQA